MNNIRLNNDTIQIAEEWNELTSNQVLKLCDIIFYNRKKKLTKSAWSYAVLYVLLNIKWYQLRFLWNFLKVEKVDIVFHFFPLIKFLKDRNELTEFKIRSFRIGFRKYFAPGNYFSNLTLEEYKYADHFYASYNKEKNIDDLEALVAVLYREKSEAPTLLDNREAFDEAKLVKNAKRMMKLPLTYKQAILLSYEGCRNHLATHCPRIFQKGEEETNKRDFGFEGLILELSGNKFGDYENTKKTFVKKAFNLIEMEMEKAAKKQSK